MEIMTHWKTATDYDHQASDYDVMRRPGCAVVAFLTEVFTSAARRGKILSIGCGTGQYERAVFHGRGVIGLDLSPAMLEIAASRIAEVKQGDMVALPFPDASFAGAYFVQSLHHVGANTKIPRQDRVALRAKAIAEAARVVNVGPIAVIQRDPEQNAAVWFWHYFPAALEVKLEIQPTIAQVRQWMESIGIVNVKATPLDDPMIKGFYEPTAPFDPAFRRAFSEFSYVDGDAIAAGLQRLQNAIEADRVGARIESSRRRFAEIGGTVFGVSGMKES
jgi:SAM-dependent methyltransferase